VTGSTAAAPARQAGLPSAAWVGTLFFIAAETMVFAGLLYFFLAYRLWSPVWPPFGEPRLALAVTLVNTAVLVASGILMRRGVGLVRGGVEPAARRALVATTALGSAFLIVQGSEWVRLVRWGLTASASPYGGIVYALIGAHGLHVMAAVVWLVALVPAGRRPLPAMARLEACALYWYFVCGLWLVIFPVVYLS
jgi:heme/copper-type cytochrome/quinol oxidase subunit 3